MADPRRDWLLRLYRQCREAAGDGASMELIEAQASAARIACHVHRLPAHLHLDHLAVALVHRLEMGEGGLRVWSGVLQSAGVEGAAQRLGLNAARLIAGRDELMLMAAALDGSDGRGGDCGALVDGETCARVAVAGLDPETELRCSNSKGALQAAGDLLGDLRGGASAALGTRYLILGLKLSARDTAALARLHGPRPARVV